MTVIENFALFGSCSPCTYVNDTALNVKTKVCIYMHEEYCKPLCWDNFITAFYRLEVICCILVTASNILVVGLQSQLESLEDSVYAIFQPALEYNVCDTITLGNISDKQ